MFVFAAGNEVNKVYWLGRWIPLLCFLLVFSIRSADAQDRLTLGLTTRTGSTSLPFVVAQEKGFFKAEGLNAIVVIKIRSW